MTTSDAALTAKFNSGRIVITPGAEEALRDPDEAVDLLKRHVSGDWGDVEDEDKVANDDALTRGERLVSSYTTAGGIKIWIITDADRAYTTIMLPSEY